jgi:hypothetical protein
VRLARRAQARVENAPIAIRALLLRLGSSTGLALLSYPGWGGYLAARVPRIP